MSTDERPLSEVVASLKPLSKKLDEVDDKISMVIATIERRLVEMRVEKVLSTKLPDKSDLGWSYDRRRRLWRLVIRTDDDVIDLRSCSREERAEVFVCGAMEKLVALAKEQHAQAARLDRTRAPHAPVARRTS